MLYSALFVAAVAGSAIAAPCPNTARSVEARYKQDILEDYEGYHLRYIALDCQHQHNSTFFDDCCRPVKAGLNATEVLNEYCTPNATALESASARIAKSSSAVGDDASAEDDADDAFCAAEVTPTAVADVPAPSAAPSEQPAPEVVNAAAQEPSSAQETHTEANAAQATPAPQEEKPQEQPQEEAPKEEQPQQEAPKEEAPKEEKPQEAPSSGGGNWIEGTASYYDQDDGVATPGQAAACGQRYSNSDHVVALPAAHGFNTGNQGHGCNAQVTIEYTNDAGERKVATAPAVDACPSCGPNQIDLSTSLWQSLESNTDKGILNIKWSVAA